MELAKAWFWNENTTSAALTVTPVVLMVGHLAYSLREYQTAMLDFAEKSDCNEADRTAEGFARMFGSYFTPEFSIAEGNAWMSVANNSVQYVATIRPGEKVAKLVKRMHYVSFVGMFRSDFFGVQAVCALHNGQHKDAAPADDLRAGEAEACPDDVP